MKSKRLFFILGTVASVTIGISMIFLSCNKSSKSGTVTSAPKSTIPIKIATIDNSVIKEKVTQWEIKTLGSLIRFKGHNKLQVNDIGSSLDSISFNYDSLTLVTVNSDTVIVAKQYGGNNSPYAYTIGFYASNNSSNININSAMIVKVDSVSQYVRYINYYNASCELVITMEINTKTDAYSVLYSTTDTSNVTNANIINKLKISSMKNSYAVAGGGCGQATANCVNAAYTNSGWASVALWAQSAFVPQTVLVLIAACALANCATAPK